MWNLIYQSTIKKKFPSPKHRAKFLFLINFKFDEMKFNTFDHETHLFWREFNLKKNSLFIRNLFYYYVNQTASIIGFLFWHVSSFLIHAVGYKYLVPHHHQHHGSKSAVNLQMNSRDEFNSAIITPACVFTEATTFVTTGKKKVTCRKEFATI